MSGRLDPLGEALEAGVPARERHARGQYFTPEAVIDLVLGLVGAPQAASDAPPGAPRILDPSCGSGRFLLAAQQAWGLRQGQLIGVDSDPEAVAAARSQLPQATIVGGDFLGWEGVGLVDCILGNPPYVRRRGRKRDLYVDFLEVAARHLRPGGRLGFVLSSAWLDVGYGQEVRECLLRHYELREVVESGVERWFPGAKVQTVIVVADRRGPREARQRNEVRFGELRRPLPASPTWVRRCPQSDLPSDSPWGPLLRAPDAFFQPERPGGLPWVALGDLARVRRGYTTNDNAFFYPPEEAGIEAQWTVPLLKGARGAGGVHGKAEYLSDRVLLCSASRDQLRDAGQDGLLRWLGQHRPEGGPASWSLPAQAPSRLFVFKGIADRFRQPLFDRPVRVDQQVYRIEPRYPSEVDDESLAAVLNSSWAALALECVGRVNFGEGVLWLGAAELKARFRLPDLRQARPTHLEGLRAAFAGLPSGPVPRANERLEDPLWGPAQRQLDDALGGIAGWSEKETAAIAEAARRLCLRRLARTRPLLVAAGRADPKA